VPLTAHIGVLLVELSVCVFVSGAGHSVFLLNYIDLLLHCSLQGYTTYTVMIIDK
jgi:hypothetical protein